MQRPIFLVEHGRIFKCSAGWLTVFICALFGQIACDLSPSEKKAPAEAASFPLLEPDRPKKVVESRCLPVVESKPLVLRAVAADAGQGPSAVEVGSVVSFGSGFAVAGLNTGAATSAFVTWADGQGRQKTIQLGRVHGAVEPPVLAAAGPHLVVALIDNDAMNTRIRLARIAPANGESEVTWGPEVQARRDESSGVSLAILGEGETNLRGLLAWDDFSRSTSRSQLRGLWFSPGSMKAEGGQFALSPASEDSVEPRLASRRDGGAWLSWIAYDQVSPVTGPREPDRPLVEEPPRRLHLASLGRGDTKFSSARTLSSSGSSVLAFDTAALGNDLLVAYRVERSGSKAGDESLELRRVTLGGAVAEGAVGSSELGPGAPLILSDSNSKSAWLLARGEEQQVLLGEFDDAVNVLSFREEPGLEGQIPTLRSGTRLFSMRPDGMDLRFSLSDCFGAAPPSASGKSSP